LRSLQKAIGSAEAITEDWDESSEEEGIQNGFEDSGETEGDGIPVSKRIKIESENGKKRKRGSVVVGPPVNENPQDGGVEGKEKRAWEKD